MSLYYLNLINLAYRPDFVKNYILLVVNVRNTSLSLVWLKEVSKLVVRFYYQICSIHLCYYNRNVTFYLQAELLTAVASFMVMVMAVKNIKNWCLLSIGFCYRCTSDREFRTQLIVYTVRRIRSMGTGIIYIWSFGKISLFFCCNCPGLSSFTLFTTIIWTQFKRITNKMQNQFFPVYSDNNSKRIT